MGTRDLSSSETHRLLERIQAGDREAFDRLFARHRAFLRQLIEWRMDPRVRQRVDASDLVQEAQMEAARRLPGFLENPPMPFKLWLRQIAYDRVLMVRRKHVEADKRAVGREMPLPDETSVQLAQRVVATQSSPSQAVMRGELAARVHAAIAKLSDVDREVLVMRLMEGLSNKEIAQVLRVEPAAANKRYGRALLRLRNALGQVEQSHEGGSEPR